MKPLSLQWRQWQQCNDAIMDVTPIIINWLECQVAGSWAVAGLRRYWHRANIDGATECVWPRHVVE